MKVSNNNGMTIIMPEDGCLLYNIKTNQYHEKVYLGKFDDVSNYKDIDKALLEPSNQSAADLVDIINKQNEVIFKMAEQLKTLTEIVSSGKEN